MLMAAGFYYIIATRNIMRALIGVELLMKAATLFIIIAGHVGNCIALAQALVITLIIIEVVIIAVACGVVISVFQKTNSLDSRMVMNIKG